MIRVFSHWIHWKTIVRISLDIALPVVCVALAMLFWGIGGQADPKILISYAAIYALVMVAFNYWLGLYNRTALQKRTRAILSVYLSVPIAYSVFALLSMLDDNQGLIFLSGVAALSGTFLHGIYMMYGRAGRLASNRVLIFGSGPDARMVGKVIKKSAPDVKVVGFYRGPSESDVLVPRKLLLPRSTSLSDTARAQKVNEIIIAVQERRGGALPMHELLECKLSGISVLDLASYFERALGQIRLDSLKAGWLIFGEGFRQNWMRTFIKRAFDVMVAGILLLLASPVMLATALLIALEDGFPVLYKQERVGLNGRLFKVVKFRSMRRDAEGDGKPRWASANDDRITRVGRVIRKLRIDELPQLYSVLTGDMSLVGPRPERPYFVDKLTRDIPFYAVRHSVKPGVTGWAQVSYHYGASVDDSIQKLQYDLY
ncbi:MAG: TIGR03013 family PEP-CTERM/XrtA system glycosyltransferase, partial [Candidatus Accumulibacter sp.]|nr:TIGR03013 family PEP-CTERM/XrtA system glycosyltransferase [Accumulibacter sp.]